MLLDLNKDQQKVFNRLKKAYKDCKELKITLINQYGTIHAYDGNLVLDMGDSEIKPNAPHIVAYDAVIDKFVFNSNTINNVDPGRSDDEIDWVLGLTEKGYREFEKDV